METLPCPDCLPTSVEPAAASIVASGEKATEYIGPSPGSGVDCHTCRKRPFSPRAILVLVPSLSWQMIVWQFKHGSKQAFSAPWSALREVKKHPYVQYSTAWSPRVSSKLGVRAFILSYV
jgi:hypothetical protein